MDTKNDTHDLLGNRIEKKQGQRDSTELKPDRAGEVSVEELFFMRLGTLKFRQNWLDREVSPSLTRAVMFGIGLVGFLSGFVACRLLDSLTYHELTFRLAD